jgi:hypothetical protein
MKNKDFTDPFDAGQLVGMLVMLKFIEKNNGIPAQVLDELVTITSTNLQSYFEKPSEDIHLMIDKLVKEIE